LPYFFARSLHEKLGQSFFIALGAANLYGWIAYTIYDNIIDDAAQIPFLPLANVCLREVVMAYGGKQIPQEFRPALMQMMDVMEAANTWEVAETRVIIKGDEISLPVALPDYGDYRLLADKSFGHALGPLTVLAKLGFSDGAAEMELATKLFRHYLIARQLNDDAHDWQDDFKKGQLNSVGVIVLKQWQASNSGEPGPTIRTGIILPQLQEIFWRQTIKEAAQLILLHTDLVRQYSQRLAVIKNGQFVETMLQPLELAARQALDESSRAQDFLTAFQPFN
jgi:hypothetical protein